MVVEDVPHLQDWRLVSVSAKYDNAPLMVGCSHVSPIGFLAPSIGVRNQ
jgi:hypothetical protein